MARQASKTLLPEAKDWAIRHLSARGPLVVLKPRQISDLHELPTQKPLPLELELDWAIGLFRHHKAHLCRFIDLMLTLENSLLDDSYETAKFTLDQIEEKVGPSLFLISVRIAFHQIHGGLEVQKKYIKEIRRSNVQHNIKFLAYWWGVRAEENSSVDSYVSNIRRQGAGWQVAEEYRAYLLYHLIGQIPSEGREADLLASGYTSSIVDLYVSFRRLAMQCVIERRSTAANFVSACQALNGQLNDPLLARLTQADIRMPSSQWADYVIFENVSEPSVSPTNLNEFAWAQKVGSYSAPNDFLRNLARQFHALSDPTRFRRAEGEIRKIGLMLSPMHVGSWLEAFAKQGYPEQLRVDHEALQSRFYTAPSIDIEGLVAIDTADWPEARRIIEECRSGQFAAALVRGTSEIPGELKIEYLYRQRIFDAFRNNDGGKLLEDGRALAEATEDRDRLALDAQAMGTWWRHGLQAAISFVLDLVLKDEALKDCLPIQPLAYELLNNYDRAGAKISDAVLLQIATDIEPNDFASSRSYAIEDAIENLGFSQLTDFANSDAVPQSNLLEYFLMRVCTRHALRRTTLFDNSADLLDDRIGVLRWISSSDSPFADEAAERAKDLARSQQVKKGLEVLKGSKISIDRGPLFNWAEDNIKEDYSRFVALVQSGLFEIDDDLRNAVYAFIEKGPEASGGLAVPDNEAADLFVRLVARTVRELATNAEHGLDAYLSLRIRHGTLSGHLRGAVEREHLITRKTKAGDYLDNEFWFDKIATDNGTEVASIAQMALRDFSGRLDAIIDELGSEIIQIKTDEKPRGLLNFDVPAALATSMIIDVDKNLTFEHFFDTCESAFWSLLTVSRTAVQESLTEIGSRIEQVFDDLSTDTAMVRGPSSGLLRDAILRVKSAMGVSLEEISEWLQTPTEKSEVNLRIRELIDVSISTLSKFYPEFTPIIDYKLEGVEEFKVANGLRFFTDVFFIIFENALKYSGGSTQPKISVRVWADDGMMWFDIRNSVTSHSVIDKQRIDDARSRVESGQYKTALRKEGGTGLPKLAKLLDYNQTEERKLDFGFDDQAGEFFVKFNSKMIIPHGQ